MASIDYRPTPTVKHFIKHFRPKQFFADWIIGPVGSGKTTGIFFKLIYLARMQAPSPVDGKRRVRAVIVRNTAPQLQDTTIVSWNIWFKHGVAGTWHATDKRFVLRFADVECEVLFRALDTPDDVARVLSLETTFAILDEFVQIPKEIVEALTARCGRFPAKKDGGATNWGMWGSSNPGNEDDWWYDALNNAEPFILDESEEDRQIRINERILEGKKESNWTFFRQPSGFSPDAENLGNLPPYEEGNHQYYESLAKDHSDHWVKQFVEGEWGYSLSGMPVINTFNFDIHVAKSPITPNPHLPLIGGFDPGMNCAMIFGQLDLNGRLLVTDELIQRDMGAQRFAVNRVQPLLRTKYPGYDFLISADPASAQRTQTDERTVLQTIGKHLRVKIADSNNRLRSEEHTSELQSPL